MLRMPICLSVSIALQIILSSFVKRDKQKCHWLVFIRNFFQNFLFKTHLFYDRPQQCYSHERFIILIWLRWLTNLWQMSQNRFEFSPWSSFWLLKADSKRVINLSFLKGCLYEKQASSLTEISYGKPSSVSSGTEKIPSKHFHNG